jgi:hypothetical protein
VNGLLMVYLPRECRNDRFHRYGQHDWETTSDSSEAFLGAKTPRKLVKKKTWRQKEMLKMEHGLGCDLRRGFRSMALILGRQGARRSSGGHTELELELPTSENCDSLVVLSGVMAFEIYD